MTARIRERPVVAGVVGLVVVAVAVGWWQSRRVDGANVIAKVNAHYSSVAGYEADIGSSLSGDALNTIMHRRAVMVAGRLTEMTEETLPNPRTGKVLRTFVDDSMNAATFDGRPCWSVSTRDVGTLRMIGIGETMIPTDDRLVSARRGGHGYLIETDSPNRSAAPSRITWDIAADSFQVYSRTITAAGLTTQLRVTRELRSAPDLVRPDLLCTG